jgi:peroxiredoxin
VSVNDAFVMGAWGRDQKTGGKVRMMADGSAAFAKATGLTLDLTGKWHGPALQPLLDAGGRRRGEDAQRRSPGKFEVSDADTMLRQAAEGLTRL